MRLAILSPSLPPEVCGVGDYSAQVIKEFVHAGHEVCVWTCHPKALEGNTPLEGFPNLKLFLSPRPWGVSTFLRLLWDLRSLKAQKQWMPDAFLVQYTPYTFAPKTCGVHPGLPLFVFLLRLLYRIPVILVAHELHYPFLMTLQGICLGPAHYLQWIGLLFAATHVVFTYETPCLKYRKIFWWKQKRLTWIPVGTNILPNAEVSELDLYSIDPWLASIPKDQVVLLHFGRGHPTNLLSYTFRVLREAQKKWGKNRVSLFFIGVSQDKINEELKKFEYRDIQSQTFGLGFLSERQASLWISRANLLLAPFLDGVSTRRTSVMAAFAHAKPVTTTFNWSTNPSIPWSQFCVIMAAEDEEKYVNDTLQLLSNPERAKKLGLAGKQYFDACFSWTRIGEKFLEVIRSAL